MKRTARNYLYNVLIGIRLFSQTSSDDYIQQVNKDALGKYLMTTRNYSPIPSCEKSQYLIGYEYDDIRVWVHI